MTGVAMRWAAAAAGAAANSGEHVDTSIIVERLERIRDLAKHFSRSKKALSTAQSGLDTIRDDLDTIRGSLLELVDDIARELRPPVADRRVA